MNGATVLTAAHMERAAYVYVRQSSEFQARNNVGRQRLQYALSDHAGEPGFSDITVIDDDPGISGDGVHRPGFESLLEAVCRGKVGLVLSIEASSFPGTERVHSDHLSTSLQIMHSLSRVRDRRTVLHAFGTVRSRRSPTARPCSRTGTGTR